jgi:hypothetical protein
MSLYRGTLQHEDDFPPPTIAQSIALVNRSNSLSSTSSSFSSSLSSASSLFPRVISLVMRNQADDTEPTTDGSEDVVRMLIDGGAVAMVMDTPVMLFERVINFGENCVQLRNSIFFMCNNDDSENIVSQEQQITNFLVFFSRDPTFLPITL